MMKVYNDIIRDKLSITKRHLSKINNFLLFISKNRQHSLVRGGLHPEQVANMSQGISNICWHLFEDIFINISITYYYMIIYHKMAEWY